MDLLRIAQEHHRGGRYRQAEEIYRGILEREPGNIDALHWLGVLTMQSGRVDEAIPMLERTAEARPGDSAFVHNLAQAYLSARRNGEAVKWFDKAVALNPSPKVIFSAGIANLSMQTPQGIARAIELFGQAREAGMNTGELHQHLGLALLLADRLDEALVELQEAVRKLPETAEPHLHFAAAWARKGQRGPARVCLARALEIDPNFSQAAYVLAMMEAEDGRLAEAEALLRAAISMKPDSVPAYQGLAAVLQKAGLEREGREAAETAMALAQGKPAPVQSGTTSESIAALEARLARSPEAQRLHVLLSTKSGVAPPTRLPPGSISGLFDKYAEQFDRHLVEKLDYHVPELIRDTVAGAERPEVMDILDLGCGTGLCGPLLRSMAKTLVGVDASAEMIKKARARLAYDRLEVGDIVEFMKNATGGYDLLVAADVLVYVGDLTPFFEGAVRAMRKDGMLIFSVEADSGDRFAMQKETRRFTHSEMYVRHLAEIFDLNVELVRPITVRTEAGKPVAGYLVLLRKTG